MSMSTTRPRALTPGTPVAEPRSLQVSGLESFEESQWRKCILHYLCGIWQNLDRVTYRPKVQLGEITLRLEPEDREYHAYGRPVELGFPAFSDGETLRVGREQTEVELGLARFVRDDRIKALVVSLEIGSVCLWKKSEPTSFGITSIGIPANLEEAVERLSR